MHPMNSKFYDFKFILFSIIIVTSTSKNADASSTQSASMGTMSQMQKLNIHSFIIRMLNSIV